MVAEGFISEETMKEAIEEELEFKRSSYITGDAPFYIRMVKEYLSSKYGERMVYQGGLKIYTTLDLDLQRAANESFNEVLKKNHPEDLQAH